jgi:hypothetical protein
MGCSPRTTPAKDEANGLTLEVSAQAGEVCSDVGVGGQETVVRLHHSFPGLPPLELLQPFRTLKVEVRRQPRSSF